MVAEPADRPQAVVALLCPFTPDRRIDGGALAEHVEFLVEGPTSYRAPLG